MGDSSVFGLCNFDPSDSFLADWSLPLPDTRTVECEEIDASVRARQHYLSSQVLTPPSSDIGSEGEDYACNNTVSDAHTVSDAPTVSISTTFHTAANLLPIPTDLALISLEGVFFHVHTTQVRSVSTNDFNHIVPPNPATPSGVSSFACISEPAAVLNVLLHAVYNLSCAHYKQSLDTLITAVDAMPSYGMSPKVHVRPLFDLILGLAPTQPLNVYALASRHDLYALAKPVSSHLLSFPLDTFTDELASKITAGYLNRLFLLHIKRLDTLKRLLLPAPELHPSTPDCDFVEQKKLTAAWVLAAGYLAWEARADVSPSVIEGALLSLVPHLSCGLCKEGLAARVKDVIGRWSFVQRTI